MGVRQLLQEFRSAAFLDPRLAVDDEVLSEPYVVDSAGLNRQGDAAVPPHILHLLTLEEMGRYDLITVGSRPDAGYLGSPVLVEGHEMRKPARLDNSRTPSEW
jgi:hypothetical protein